MTKKRVIGKANTLPWHVPDDLKNFKRLTSGHPVVMGRKTYDSICSRLGRPLPNRENIVLSRSMEEMDGVRVAGSINEALELGEALDTEVYVIGGASVYAQAMPFADKLCISWIDGDFTGDTFFPEIPDDFEEVFSEQREGFTYAEYVRIAQ